MDIALRIASRASGGGQGEALNEDRHRLQAGAGGAAGQGEDDERVEEEAPRADADIAGGWERGNHFLISFTRADASSMLAACRNRDLLPPTLRIVLGGKRFPELIPSTVCAGSCRWGRIARSSASRIAGPGSR